MSLDAARKEAARVAAHVDLRDVRLWGVQADLDSVPDQGDSQFSFRFNADVQVQHSSEHEVVLVLGTYSLAVTSDVVPPSDEDESEDVAATLGDSESRQSVPKDIASIDFRLNALFRVERQPDDPFTESELTAFGQTTGQFALYPYAREFIADMTGRMGLPPLHVGVMRLHLESRDD